MIRRHLVAVRAVITAGVTVLLMGGAVLGFAQLHRSSAPAAAAQGTPNPVASSQPTPAITTASPSVVPSPSAAPPSPTAVVTAHPTPVPTHKPTPTPTAVPLRACRPSDFSFTVHTVSPPSKWWFGTWSMRKVSAGRCQLGGWSVTLHMSGGGSSAAGDGNGPPELLSQGQSIPGPGSDPFPASSGSHQLWATSSSFGTTNTVSFTMP